MKNENNAELCDCPCHEETSEIKHAVPCCYPCPFCRKFIKPNYYRVHLRECKSKVVKLLEEQEKKEEVDIEEEEAMFIEIIKAFEEVLEFYADINNYEPTGDDNNLQEPSVLQDLGSKARNILQKYDLEEENKDEHSKD
jgi:hypothetical protein